MRFGRRAGGTAGLCPPTDVAVGNSPDLIAVAVGFSRGARSWVGPSLDPHDFEDWAGSQQTPRHNPSPNHGENVATSAQTQAVPLVGSRDEELFVRGLPYSKTVVRRSLSCPRARSRVASGEEARPPERPPPTLPLRIFPNIAGRPFSSRRRPRRCSVFRLKRWPATAWTARALRIASSINRSCMPVPIS